MEGSSNSDETFIDAMRKFPYIVIPTSYRFLLHDTDHLLYIEEGDIDLFGLRLIDDRLQSGKQFLPMLKRSSQSFLADLIEGPTVYIHQFFLSDILFPFSNDNANETLVIGAANSEAMLRKIPISAMQEILEKHPKFQHFFFIKFADWCEKLLTVLKLPEKRDLLADATLEVGEQFRLLPGERAFIPKIWKKDLVTPVKWLYIREGHIHPGQVYNLELNGPLYFPVIPPITVECSTLASLELFDEIEVADRNNWEGVIKGINSIILEQLDYRELVKEVESGQKALLRTANDASLFSNTFKNLSSVIFGKERFTKYTGENLLVSALNIIGGIQDLHFTFPGKLKQEDIFSKVKSICLHSNIRFRTVDLSGNWWKEESVPILSFYKNHETPVILVYEKRRYNLFDPRKQQWLPVDQPLSDKIGNTGIVFYRSFSIDKPVDSWEIIKFSWKNISYDVSLLLLVGLGNVALGLTFPFAYKFIFDDIIPHYDLTMLIQILFGLIVAITTKALFSITQEYIMRRIQALVVHDIQMALWDRLLRIPVNFFRKITVADLIQRVYAVDTIQQELSGAILSSMLNGIFSFVFIAAMFYFSTTLSLIGLGIIFINLVLMKWGVAMTHFLNLKNYDLTSKISAKLLQVLWGISKVRTSAAEKRIFSLWSMDFVEKIKVDYQLGKTFGGLEVVRSSFQMLGVLGIYTGISYALSATGSGGLAAFTAGTFFAFQSAYGTFIDSIYGFTTSASKILSGLILWKKTEEIRKEGLETSAETYKVEELKGEIHIQNVSFRYEEDAFPVLNDVSLTINYGEFIGIVGPSGCGKSTLLRLMIGFEKPEKGVITYDKRDLSTIDPPSLRRQMGIVLQNSKILEGTVKEIIAGEEEYPEEKIWKAIRMASLEKDILALPNGLNTVLSSEVETLSGGQMQRLLIARALVGDAKIVMLDEATNSIDINTEEVISNNFKRIHATRIVVSHNLRTIKDADRIYVLKGGSIVEEGTYDQLVSKGGYFAQMVRIQQI